MIFRLFPLLFLLMVAPSPLWAATTEWFKDDALSARLFSAQDSLDASTLTVDLGLDLKLEKDWHTYWRTPGEAGTPPAFTIEGSDNVAALTLDYPVPQRMSLMGMETLGYHGTVLFPLHLTRENADRPVTLKAGLDLLLCNNLCVPKHITFMLHLPQGDGATSAEKPLIDVARASIPARGATRNLNILNMFVGNDHVSLDLEAKAPFAKLDLLVETTDPMVSFGSPEIIYHDDNKATLIARLLAPLSGDSPSLQNLGPFTLTVINGAEAFETSLAAPVQTDPAPVLAFSSILLLALLGGFILNLMPCVLPVLSMKVLAVIKHAGGSFHAVRHVFLYSAAGIFVSFLMLGGVTIGLKLSGQTIGWGVQFQQPVFLAFMIALLTFFAANLWGFFEITLPRFVMDRLDAHKHPKLAGAFATGMLATLLATPCSAPFLGTAVGFALTAGWIEIILVFAALGLGMALPYLAFALWPQMATKLPKPGLWMVKLTRLLGFGLAATAVWLLIVISAQIGWQASLLIAFAMLAILLSLYLRHRKVLGWLAGPVTVMALAATLTLAIIGVVPDEMAPESGHWQPFDVSKIEGYLHSGKIVFVDVTADWCLTCKYNKRFVLAQPEVARQLFDIKDVIAMQADWTNPDPTITSFLQKYGRFGIPFNAVFGPRAPQGILLPELLTAPAVLDALDKAKAKTCPTDLPPAQSC